MFMNKAGRKLQFYYDFLSLSILTAKETLQPKSKLFIQAVISSNYVEINQQKLLLVSCFEGISNFVQRYHQTGVNQGRNLTSRMSSLNLNF